MRTLLLFFAGVAAAFPQFSLGVKGGLPLTDFINTVSSPNPHFDAQNKMYVVGPSVQIGLPAGFAIEFDALYRRMDFQSTATLVDVLSRKSTTSNAWEFPLLLKYHLPFPVVKPFVDGGVAWENLSGIKQTVTNTIFPAHVTTTSTSNPPELRNTNTVGIVVGGGVDIHAWVIHFVPEVRYTRWGAHHFEDVTGLLKSNQNQAEFLLGIRF